MIIFLLTKETFGSIKFNSVLLSSVSSESINELNPGACWIRDNENGFVLGSFIYSKTKFKEV